MAEVDAKVDSNQCGMGHLHYPYYPATMGGYHDPYLGYPYPSTVGGFLGSQGVSAYSVPYQNPSAPGVTCGCGCQTTGASPIGVDASSIKHPCDDYCEQRQKKLKERVEAEKAEKSVTEMKAIQERDDMIKMLQTKLELEKTKSDLEKEKQSQSDKKPLQNELE